MILEGRHAYWEPQVQQQLETLMQTFENSTYVMDKLYTDCWLREWLNLVENSQGVLNIDVSTREAWMASLKEVTFWLE